ncbi:hypothetical protein HKD21_11605 [Gluconobacter cerevisiae]|uniref:Uncharacterized protein n=2 Tax=Gluconobacter TaxID=441 RepID=A0ABR9YGN1_9PROT|nr:MULTISPECIES: hypothetical protein [Gluconobacter]MBF0877489.1 hypothetical protein [Gluconobacter cerevisiae]GBR28996.1 hypothetical protein AA3266_0008 [Gluconobacter kondonii NBRC 3266]GLQ66064.1 hypothetical protein GCM10007870_16480 [Gluconobacter kondonii]
MILHENTVELLKKKFQSAQAYQRKMNIQFDLTFEDYKKLWIKNVDALTHLNNAVIYAVEHRINKTIKLPYCLTWKPEFVRTGSPMNIKTAWIRSAEESKRDCRLKQGEKKTEKAKAKLRRPKAPWSEERKANRVAAMKGRKRGSYQIKQET